MGEDEKVEEKVEPNACSVCIKPLDDESFTVLQLSMTLITQNLEETYEDCHNRLVCKDCVARLRKLFNKRQIMYKAERRTTP